LKAKGRLRAKKNKWLLNGIYLSIIYLNLKLKNN
jgi:hypothetical protein